MKKSMIVFILCLFFLVPSSFASPIQWNSAVGNDHYYEFITDAKTWTEAVNFAQSEGGYLVSIQSADEDAFVRSLFEPYSYSVGGETWTEQYWLGGSYNNTTSNWEWVSGETISYTNWLGGESSASGSGSYQEIYMHGTYNQDGWRDESYLSNQDQVHHFAFVIEYETNPDSSSTVPEPTTIALFGIGLLGLSGVARRKS